MTDLIDDRLPLQPTVFAYLTDPAVRTGVDALLAVRNGQLPPGMNLSELEDYLTARGAAELTRYDWAAMLHLLWEVTWGNGLPSTWRKLSVDEALETECIVRPDDCWENGSFTFCHTHNGYWIYSAVSVTQECTEIAFGVETKSGKSMAKTAFADFTWKDDDDWNSWLVRAPSASPAAADFKLSTLREAVRMARENIEAITS
ncbi:hypothetical protein [Sphingomonas sp. OK281]|uniref:hypothetical protein n=1 Tax=Sphingomonas sp. OK281 TaxID=1881067 RepID=UPI0008F1B829|nr:hypothetical protein [Sphingomonas sp. OK281]SFO44982.1 hypothetical protein SAMN05428984_4299 [Sphingomonas sp. OK281]